MSNTERLAEISRIEEILQHPENLGTKVEVMTRVSGYYRPVSAFNTGKTQEYAERQSYKIAS